ncbi:NUDIX hydrolase [Stigmatella aurantiaca]|uniref:Hydrolase, nudix family n=1 Tax=Stigmatella aurantiaca (strain DW4/3-1) TaxID=378806 RepID=Q099G1_STIAD|nr:NUDIX hydrolase [Stigmatella aurantiaca]ADO75609.1 Hydrolase, nudix family [Stigmatella aurantiaca DW4/3-1]EAU68350.1 hydrolase, nudix family, putative [Stigmatella aurantiaca DW4/3-1]
MHAPLEARKVAQQLTNALTRVAYRGAYSLAMAYWFVRRPEGSGVLVGIWCGQRVLLLQNSYKRLFSMPGGGAHRGESVPETGARELREEVGLTVDPSSLRHAFEVVVWEEFKRDHVFFVELDVETEPPLTLDQREVVWADFIDVRDALRLPLSAHVRAYLTDAVRRRPRTPP